MIRYFIHNGIGVAVFAIAVVLFGFLALFKLPIQLTPDVNAPTMTVTTIWPGATPEDVEQDIIIEQEKYLKSITGLTKMVSTASQSMAQIILEFSLNTDEQENIVRVNNALTQVPSYPENVDEPSIQTAGANENPIAWFGVRALPERESEIDVLDEFDFVEDYVKTRFERLQGVSSISGVHGSSARELQVMIDPVKLADRGISIFRVRNAIRSRNRDVSGGDLTEGKRRFNVRTIGRYESPADVESTVISHENGEPVYLRDVGYARVGYAERRSFIRFNRKNALAFGIVRERGSNILDLMERIRATADELNEGVLKQRGLYITQATDDTQYVKEAVTMVRNNLLIGGLLAIGTLLIFPAPLPLDLCAGDRDSAVHYWLVFYHQCIGTFNQRDLAGGAGLFHWCRAGCVDRCAGEYFPPSLDGQGTLPGGGRRHPGSVDGNFVIGVDQRCCVRADHHFEG